jgi:hypothetical protein
MRLWAEMGPLFATADPEHHRNGKGCWVALVGIHGNKAVVINEWGAIQHEMIDYLIVRGELREAWVIEDLRHPHDSR